ncbi:MAG: DUF4974 domain-containing protein [Bacteroidales bacterium]|nr:DUF4974 domain-containing protein [Bacteroidales bacterium]
MKDSFDKKLDFVVGNYEEGIFSPEEVIGNKKVRSTRRLWTVAAFSLAMVAVAFAAGYGIMRFVDDSKTVVIEQPAPLPEETPHEFVFDNTPIADVLDELGSYYGCTMSTPSTDKRLTATFSDDDLDTIVSVIESVLDIHITVR